MKRFLIGFAFCFLQLAAFSFCSGDEPVPAHFTEWKAETLLLRAVAMRLSIPRK